jgi:hypothetical protein
MNESKVAWHGKKDWGKARHAAPTDTRAGLEVVLT